MRSAQSVIVALRSWGIDPGLVIDTATNGVNEDMMLLWLHVCIIFLHSLLVSKAEGKVFCNLVANRRALWNLKKKKKEKSTST